MKKLITLFAVILFGVSTSFATNPPIVQVTWDADECSCGSVFADFKVTISIYDNANTQYAVPDKTLYPGSGSANSQDFDVEEMLDYCHDSHPNTPSFTVTATVWGILVGDTECCTGSNTEPGDCHDFEADDIFYIVVNNMN